AVTSLAADVRVDVEVVELEVVRPTGAGQDDLCQLPAAGFRGLHEYSFGQRPAVALAVHLPAVPGGPALLSQVGDVKVHGFGPLDLALHETREGVFVGHADSRADRLRAAGQIEHRAQAAAGQRDVLDAGSTAQRPAGACE